MNEDNFRFPWKSRQPSSHRILTLFAAMDKAYGKIPRIFPAYLPYRVLLLRVYH